MKREFATIAAIACAVFLSGCADASIPQVVAETRTSTSCVDPPDLITAVETIVQASNDPSAVQVYGEAGGRTNNMFQLMQRDDLAAMENPRGGGVVVSLVYNGDGASARDTAHRAGWLVLDGFVYPIDVDAAEAFGVLWNGYPDSIKQTAGLGENYFGMDQYGLADIVAYNADTTADYDAFLTAANDLCESPTPLG